MSLSDANIDPSLSPYMDRIEEMYNAPFIFIKHPATTYLVRVTGDSMIDEGVEEGDFLIVDRSMTPTEKHLSVCMFGGEFALKRIVQSEGHVFLMAGNKRYKPIEVTNNEDFRVFGVVVWLMKKKA